MEIDLTNLPDDAQALKALVQRLLGTMKTQGMKIAQLQDRLAKLRRTQFGQFLRSFSVRSSNSSLNSMPCTTTRPGRRSSVLPPSRS